MEQNYLEVNQTNWNERVAIHLESAFYDVAGFKAGASSLKPIEIALVGDVAGRSMLHLQCHFGQDTLSFARMGATVTGIDFSTSAIAAAKALAEEMGLPASFHCCNVYDTRRHVQDRFDLVFTSYGVVGWLPDLEPWAEVIAESLVSGGSFVLVEFHPVVWMYDDQFSRIAYDYAKSAPIEEESNTTYTDGVPLQSALSVSWNHSLSEVVTALLSKGLLLEVFQEFDYSPYTCFAGLEEQEPGKFRISHLQGRIPMVYALRMRKP